MSSPFSILAWVTPFVSTIVFIILALFTEGSGPGPSRAYAGLHFILLGILVSPLLGLICSIIAIIKKEKWMILGIIPGSLGLLILLAMVLKFAAGYFTL